ATKSMKSNPQPYRALSSVRGMQLKFEKGSDSAPFGSFLFVKGDGYRRARYGRPGAEVFVLVQEGVRPVHAGLEDGDEPSRSAIPDDDEFPVIGRERISGVQAPKLVIGPSVEDLTGYAAAGRAAGDGDDIAVAALAGSDIDGRA